MQQAKREPLTDEQAQEMLDRLEEHFREPVLPMSRYCKEFETWMRCISDLAKNSKSPQNEHGASYAPHISRIWTDIKKSNLLARLLYAKEPLRTRRCPVHNGRWSGIGDCEHGCDETGWIREAETGAPPA